MTTPDWAARKAQQYIVDGFDQERCAKLLRAERRRAVRAIHKLTDKLPLYTSMQGNVAYKEACDDCARAIGG